MKYLLGLIFLGLLACSEQNGTVGETPTEEDSRERKPSADAEEYAQELREWLKNNQGKFKDCPECPEMVNIPAGNFMMGSANRESNEKPVHQVSVKAFAMGKYEVTFVEYDAFARATGRDLPKGECWGRKYRSVINVSGHDAVAYTEWLSQKTGKTYRLPTEAEWEYAARAGTDTDYWWGNTASHEYANYGKDECCSGLAQGKDQWEYTAPVGSFEPNPFGLHDTAGNVWEWTCSRYSDAYGGSELTCDMTNEGSRVLRGGSWFNRPDWVRSTTRGWSHLTYRNYRWGFRVVASSL